MLFAFLNDSDEKIIFSSIYEKYRGNMIKFVEHYAPSVAGYAEDIVQEAFIKLFKGIRHWKHLKENEKKAYILVSVRNQTITMINKLKLTEKGNNIIDDEETFFYRDEIDLIYENESNDTFMREMSNVLSDSLLEILVLKYGCNLRNKDIANILNIKQDTVSVRDHRLRAKVLEYLETKDKRK